MATHADYASAVTEKVSRTTLIDRENIVVEIEKLLVESFDAMEVHLDGVGVECRQQLDGDNVAVVYHVNLIAIDPLGHLSRPRHDKVDLAYPRHIDLDATKKILQRPPVAKTLLEDRRRGVALVVALPLRVESVDVCYDYIH